MGLRSRPRTISGTSLSSVPGNQFESLPAVVADHVAEVVGLAQHEPVGQVARESAVDNCLITSLSGKIMVRQLLNHQFKS